MKLIYIIYMLGMSTIAHSQFSVIPTNSADFITDLILNDDTVYIIGLDQYIAKLPITNGNIEQLSIPTYPNGYFLKDFHIINGNYYYLTGHNYPYWHYVINKSIDKGASWSAVYDTIGPFFRTFSIVDDNFGVIAGINDVYSMTANSDTVWNYNTFFQSYFYYTSSCSYGDSSMIFLSEHGYSARTTDRGNTWLQGYCSGETQTNVEYMNKDTIYSLETWLTSNSPRSSFSYSTNGGANFQTIFIGCDNNDISNYNYYCSVYDFEFITPKYGHIVGYINVKVEDEVNGIYTSVEKGAIFETNDYGQTWIPYVTDYNEQLTSIVNVNDSIYYIGGENGLLLRWNKNIPLPNLLSITNIEKEINDFKVYQNNRTLFIELRSKKIIDANLSILDINGKLIYNNNFNEKQKINVSNYSKGVYFVKVISKEINKTKKIVIN